MLSRPPILAIEDEKEPAGTCWSFASRTFSPPVRQPLAEMSRACRYLPKSAGAAVLRSTVSDPGLWSSCSCSCDGVRRVSLRRLAQVCLDSCNCDQPPAQILLCRGPMPCCVWVMDASLGDCLLQCGRAKQVPVPWLSLSTLLEMPSEGACLNKDADLLRMTLCGKAHTHKLNKLGAVSSSMRSLARQVKRSRERIDASHSITRRSTTP